MSQIVTGRRIAALIEPFYHLIERYAVNRPLENLPDDGGGIFIDKQLVAVIRRFFIAKGRTRPHKLPVLHRLPLLGFYLFADVGGISFIYHIFQGHNQMAAAVFLVFAVKLVVDCNKPNLMQREILFDIVAAVNRVPPQPGKVFDDHAVDSAVLHIVQHPLKGFALKGAPRCAVVGVNRHDFNIRAQGKIGFHDLLLGFQRIAAPAVKFHGQTDIEGRFPDFHPHMGGLFLHNGVFPAFPCHIKPPPLWFPALPLPAGIQAGNGM